jgi:hypothetical protein
MYPVPQVSDLSNFSGQPEATYTAYADSALALAALMFSFRTEITDPSQLNGYNNLTQADAQQLATTGICAMADYLYLRQPYRSVIASPMQNENIGSYSYSKPIQEMARNAAALEVTGEASGVPLYDLAVQMLALRTLAGGVYSGAVSVFEHPRDKDDKAQIRIHRDPETGQLCVLGPSDLNVIDWPVYSLSGENFPIDP